MKFIRNLNLNQRVQLFVIPMVLFLYAISGLLTSKQSSDRQLATARNEMQVYVGKLAQIAQMVEDRTGRGFTNEDYIELKPFFQSNAYYKTDYPFIISSTGQYMVHLLKEGQRVPKDVFLEMKANREKRGFAQYQEYHGSRKLTVMMYYQYFEPYDAYIGLAMNRAEVFAALARSRAILIVLVLLAAAISFVGVFYILRPIIRSMNRVIDTLRVMSGGAIAEKLNYANNDEIGQMVESLNRVIDGLRHTSEFATAIGQNQLDTPYQTLGRDDVLGNALLGMRENLKMAYQEEARRKEEDAIRNWITAGLAKFGDILRQNNNNLGKLADNVIQNLVNYLEANQGGLFLYNDEDDDNKHLELIAAFAYNRKKFLQKTVGLGEGLVGTCAIEKQTIALKEIPDGYIEITSGLGDAPPKSLLIVPLKLEESIFGVVEVASFKEFAKHEIEFVEKIGESIASTLSAVKNSIRTNQLLEQSQQQREEMAAQEEEMRQNMEEMQATQEEMARKSIEMEGMTNAINEALLFAELDENGLLSNPNANLLALTGYARHELDGKNILELIHPDQQSFFQGYWSQVLAGGSYKDTMHWITSNGQELFLLASITPALDDMGSIYKIFFLGQDVTENKQLELRAQKQAEEIEQNLLEIRVEQELSAQREEEMKALLKALDDICIISEMDPSGQITYINSKNVEVFGDRKEDIEGRFHREIDHVAKTRPNDYNAFWNELLKGKKQIREFSIAAKGREVCLSEHYTPVVNDQGQVVKIINIGFDISESKQREQEMFRLIAQLEELKKKK